LKYLIVRFRIEEDNQKYEKRSSKNSYEAKVNVIEDSKEKAFTFKGLKRKKTAPGYKSKDQKGKNKRLTCYICNKEEYKVNKCRSHSKRNKKYQPQENLTDHASTNLSVVVSEVNLTTNNKVW